MTEHVELAFDEVKAITDMAVLIDFGDQEVWVPRSVIRQDGPTDNTLFVAEWFALKEGLI